MVHKEKKRRGTECKSDWSKGLREARDRAKLVSQRWAFQEKVPREESRSPERTERDGNWRRRGRNDKVLYFNQRYEEGKGG